MDNRELTDIIADISEAGFGYIILRDIPKQQVQIDTIITPVKGGFRGFQFVPAGPHYISVKGYRGESYSFWTYLHANEAVVKVLDPDREVLIDDTPENTEHYTNLAKSGAMASALMPYNLQGFEVWNKLTNHISEAAFPLPLHPIPDQVPNRFAYAFGEVHGGKEELFLAEFQLAFASWYITQGKSGPPERWLHLLQAIYNAGEQKMADHPRLFSQLVDALIGQFNFLQDAEFSEDSSLCYGADYLVEDLTDTEISDLGLKAKEFSDYLTARINA